MRAATPLLVAAGAAVFGFTALAGQAQAPQPAESAPEPAVPFTTHVVSTGLRGGYQVAAADMNRDGRVDLIALGSQTPELV